MSVIDKIIARQIFDSRGNPTIEVDVITNNGVVGRAAVPSGASTGQHEAVELRDGGNNYCGKGVYKAVSNVNDIIAKELKGQSVFDQEKIDKQMISELKQFSTKYTKHTTYSLQSSPAVAQKAGEGGSKIFRQ